LEIEQQHQVALGGGDETDWFLALSGFGFSLGVVQVFLHEVIQPPPEQPLLHL